MSAGEARAAPDHGKAYRNKVGASAFYELALGSVRPDDRTAQVEAVVDASGDEVNILADRVSAEYAADRYDSGAQNTCRREAVTMVAHEQVIVLDRNRPIRCESEFEARSHDTTPARFTR